MRKRQPGGNQEAVRVLGAIKRLGAAAAVLLAVGLSAMTPALAQDTDPTTGIRDEGPSSAPIRDLVLDLQLRELAEAQPYSALVYFLNPWKGEVSILLNTEPLAILPTRAFLAARVTPGVRLVWGWRSGRTATDAEWFEFQPGRTYVLTHPGTAALRGGRSDPSLGWLLEGSRALAEAWELSYAKPTEEELESLREAFRKRRVVNPEDLRRRRPGRDYRPPPEVHESAYDDAMRKAGRPSSSTSLPADFKAILTDRAMPKLFSLEGGPRGTLTVGGEALTFTSKKTSLVVPVNQIRDLCFGGFTSPRSAHEQSVPLIQLEYVPAGGSGTRTVYFKPDDAEHHAVSCLYNPIFAAISEALEQPPAG